MPQPFRPRLFSKFRFSRLLPYIYTFFILIFVISLIASVGILNSFQSYRKRSSTYTNILVKYDSEGNPILNEEYGFSYKNESCGFLRGDINVCPDLILVKANVVAVDAHSNTLRLNVKFTPFGMYAVAKNKTRLAVPVELVFDDYVVNFAKGGIMQPQSFSIPFVEGDIDGYPFDSYITASIPVTGTYTLPDNTKKPLNVLLSLSGALQSWSITFPFVVDTSPAKDGTNVEFDVTTARSYTTKFFSVFIYLMMWAISVYLFILTILVFVKDRKMEAPIVLISTNIMFALPAIRNAQPNVPSIGITADTVGFFWNMLMVAMSACMLLHNFILNKSKTLNDRVLGDFSASIRKNTVHETPLNSSFRKHAPTGAGHHGNATPSNGSVRKLNMHEFQSPLAAVRDVNMEAALMEEPEGVGSANRSRESSHHTSQTGQQISQQIQMQQAPPISRRAISEGPFSNPRMDVSKSGDVTDLPRENAITRKIHGNEYQQLH